MAGLPVMSGAVQDRSILVSGSLARFSSVRSGASGGSSTSFTLTVTAMVSSTVVSAVPLAFLPSWTVTFTLYEVLAS